MKDEVVHSLRPSFKGGHGEQRQHPVQHVVKVEIAVFPDPLPHHGVADVAVFIDHKGPSGSRISTGDVTERR